jgi:hypothetical protein
MKALTIRQPWASLVIDGHKDIENREWWTSLRGRVAIHAGKNTTKSEIREAAATFDSALGQRHDAEKWKQFTDSMPMGCIVGTVEIVDCVRQSESPWFFGRYGFVLRNPRKLTQPISINGALGFWEVPAHISELLLEAPTERPC